MKVRAVYYPKDYNAFDEVHKAEPYEITSNVPDYMTDKQIKVEAEKSCAVRPGYYLLQIDKL